MKKVNINILNTDVYLITKIKKYNSFKTIIENEVPEHTNGICSSALFEDGKMVILVGIFDNSLRTLVHELFHAVSSILSEHSIDITKENEFGSYLMDYLYDQFSKEF